MPIFEKLRRIKARIDLWSLAKTNPEMSAAILDAMAGRITEAERGWIEQIEELHRRMSASTQELEITDYGVRAEDPERMEEEISRGRIVRRTIGQICSLIARSDYTRLLLFRLARELRPQICIELGASLGISTCYIGAALTLNGRGRVITLEGADSIASVAEQNFTTLGLNNVEIIRGRFQDTLPEVFSANPRVDYVYIDGDHGEAATLKYFNLFLPSLSPTGVIIFDDIRWSAGMTRAWNSIRGHKAVGTAIDLGAIGLISMSGL